MKFKLRYGLPTLYVLLSAILFLLGKFTALGVCSGTGWICFPPALVYWFYLSYPAVVLDLGEFIGIFFSSLIIYFVLGLLVDLVIKKFRVIKEEIIRRLKYILPLLYIFLGIIIPLFFASILDIGTCGLFGGDCRYSELRLLWFVVLNLPAMLLALIFQVLPEAYEIEHLLSESFEKIFVWGTSLLTYFVLGFFADKNDVLKKRIFATLFVLWGLVTIAILAWFYL